MATKLGAAVYKLGSASSTAIGLFYSLATDIGVYDLTSTFTNEVHWRGNFMSTRPANASAIGTTFGGFRPMYYHKRHDVLYWGAFNSTTNVPQVDKFDANIGTEGTLTENALDLPKHWGIQDFGQLRVFYQALLEQDLSFPKLHQI